MAADFTENNIEKIRFATTVDVPRICEVLTRSIREICGPDYGNDPLLLDEWCANKTPETITEWIPNPKNFFIVVESPLQGIIGVGLYRRQEATINLCHLAPEGLHRGLGSKLLSSMESEARRLSHTAINVVSSITASEFYKRNGYLSNGEPVYWGKIIGFPLRKVIAI